MDDPYGTQESWENEAWGYPKEDPRINDLDSEKPPLADIGWALIDVNQLYELDTMTIVTGRDK